MSRQADTLAVQDSGSDRRLITTAAYYSGFVGLGLATSVFGPTLPSLASQTQTHIGQIGILFTAQSTGYLVGSLQGGRVYDRWRGHPIMAACLVAMALMLALMPAMPLLWSLIFVVFLLGLASGTLDVGGNTLLVWLHREKVGPFMNGLHFAFGVGTFLAPLIVAQTMLMTGRVAWAFWILALLILPSALWLVRLPSPQSRTSHDTESDKNGRLLVLLIAVFFFLNFGVEASYGGWVYTYAIKLELGTATSAAYLTSAFWGAFTFARLLAMPLSLKLRPKTFLTIDLIGAVVSLAILLSARQSVVALWIGTIGLGMSTASIVPTTIAMAERRMPLSGRTTSWFFVGGAAGGMTLPWLTGQLLEWSGGPAVMTAVAVIFGLIIIVFLGIASVPPRAEAV
jgi:MFS transporter, FHS family, Na+ dependent glucose transporter 1